MLSIASDICQTKVQFRISIAPLASCVLRSTRALAHQDAGGGPVLDSYCSASRLAPKKGMMRTTGLVALAAAALMAPLARALPTAAGSPSIAEDPDVFEPLAVPEGYRDLANITAVMREWSQLFPTRRYMSPF